jgi:hypothetical protein
MRSKNITWFNEVYSHCFIINNEVMKLVIHYSMNVETVYNKKLDVNKIARKNQQLFAVILNVRYIVIR